MSPTRPTSPASSSGQDTKHELGSGPVIARGTSLHPAVTDLLLGDRRAGGHPAHGRVVWAAATGTDADAVHATAHRRPDRGRLDPAALHALVGRAGRAVRRRGDSPAAGGVRAAARARTSCSSAEPGGRSGDGRADAAAVRRRRDARGRGGAGARAGAARGAARGPRDRRRGGALDGLAGGADRRRDRAAAVAGRGRVGDCGSTNAPTMCARPAASGTRGSVPAGPVRHGDPRDPGAAVRASASARTCTLSLVTGNYEPVGAAEARTGGARPVLRGRPGRIRLRRRGPRDAAGDRPPACRRRRRRVRARADDRDRRHPARHLLRARRRRPLPRGHDRTRTTPSNCRTPTASRRQQ